MNSKAQIGYETWEDLIFRHRNKNYGAYLLRKEQDKHLIYGFIISILPLITMFFIRSSNTKEVIIPSEPIIIRGYIIPDIIPIEPTPPIKANKGDDVIPSKPSQPKLPKELKPFIPVTDSFDDKSIVDDEKNEDDTVDLNQKFGTEENDNPSLSLNDGNIEGSDFGTGTEVGTNTVTTYNFDPDNLDKPEFVGGDKALNKYLQNNIKRINSENSQEDNLVKVVFVIDTEGIIESVDLVKSAGNPYDSEALRVVKNMPKWKPGKHGGKPAKFRMILPIRFVGRN